MAVLVGGLLTDIVKNGKPFDKKYKELIKCDKCETKIVIDARAKTAKVKVCKECLNKYYSEEFTTKICIIPGCNNPVAEGYHKYCSEQCKKEGTKHNKMLNRQKHQHKTYTKKKLTKTEKTKREKEKFYKDLNLANKAINSQIRIYGQGRTEFTNIDKKHIKTTNAIKKVNKLAELDDIKIKTIEENLVNVYTTTDRFNYLLDNYNLINNTLQLDKFTLEQLNSDGIIGNETLVSLTSKKPTAIKFIALKQIKEL